MAILGIDIGGSFVKAAVLGRGKIARVACECDASSEDRSELPLTRVWQALIAAVREALKDIDATTIEGIGLSCLTPALVLVDKSGKPLGPAYTHLDRRSRALSEKIWKEVGPEFHASTGNLPLPGGMSALTFASLGVRGVGRYLHLNGWIGAELTGEYAFDPANAAFSGLYSLFPKQEWSRRWCEYFGVDPAWLPPVQSGEATLGTLLATRAKELGLRAGLPVKLGTADTSSALLAVGAKAGDLLHVAGTTQVLATIVDKPVPHPRRLVRPLGVGNSFVHVTHNPVGGAALEWLRRLCFSELSPEIFYGETVEKALSHPTKVVLDPFYLGGDRLEMQAKTAAFQNVSLGTAGLDLLSALLQAMKQGHALALEDLGVGKFGRTYLTGGAARVAQKVLSPHAERFEEGSLNGIARLFT